MENLKRFDNDPNEKIRSFYFNARGVFDGLSDLIEEAREELLKLNQEENSEKVIKLKEKITEFEIKREVLGFVHKCTFDY